MMKKALAGVNFTHLSPDAPGATKIFVTTSSSSVAGAPGTATTQPSGKAYEIYGDWANVKVHTFRRYLHQVTGMRPAAQLLFLDGKTELVDDLVTMEEAGTKAGSVIQVKLDERKSVAAMPSDGPVVVRPSLDDM